MVDLDKQRVDSGAAPDASFSAQQARRHLPAVDGVRRRQPVGGPDKSISVDGFDQHDGGDEHHQVRKYERLAELFDGAPSTRPRVPAEAAG